MDTIELPIARLRTEQTNAMQTLTEVEKALWGEYNGGQLTTAQKIGALSELRKVVQLRGLITGIVPTPGREDAGE